MSVDLSPLNTAKRLLFTIPLTPLQGQRFQPTGFPSLGAATFQTKQGTSLLVESAQSMANRLELTIWDEASNALNPDFASLSHVRVSRNGNFLTDSILEPHRLNSAYIEKSAPLESQPQIHTAIKSRIFPNDSPLLNRNWLAEALLHFDIGSLLHGVFLESIDGRIRVSRAIEAFIEADGVRTAASGGVKNDHVNPSGITKDGFGNVPFARDEFTAESLNLYVKLDLAQIRGYGLGAEVERLLILLALYKVRTLLDGNLRLRTACDLQAVNETVSATAPKGFALPPGTALLESLRPAIAACAERMTVSEVNFNDELKKGKDQENDEAEAANSTDPDKE
ncbi:type I-G CRISPR-associated RAMP protein Csb1/Cas7g [Trichloromonas sp.]|jgi:CRISPR-associated protein Csb1|uniref:type I-G CRISPR-associated RAMP protein Csb1/Cas7g n=1 Tax=Trichloromonas sp. TaxID=3069249 RepID=UPI002A40E097|nr:type I-U CRISPR-associated RAMP protein Csb1/Cas7u [Trichloromonas sp.]